MTYSKLVKLRLARPALPFKIIFMYGGLIVLFFFCFSKTQEKISYLELSADISAVIEWSNLS